MVVALIALFVALGGPAQAKKDLIDGRLLWKNSVTGRAIKDGQVLAPDLGAGAVGQAQLAAGGVTASKLAADSVGGGSVANGSLQTVDIGSFTGSVNVDFGPFDLETNRCQVAEAPATPAGGQPNLADDVVAVSPPSGWSDFIIVTGKPAPGNVIRIVACWSAPVGATPPDPPLTTFRYVTFDAP
jgi:hypothetical protein